jgi:RimJ/RimL family protein N-acetyltransferase
VLPTSPSASHAPVVLRTRRLRLEPCHPGHLDGLHAVNSDPRVMQFISGRAETRQETLAMIERVQARWARWGHSWWSFIEHDSQAIVGAGCIQHLRKGGDEPDPACPLEIGWRLRGESWHRGLATEAAVAMASFAFDQLRAPTLYAVCDPQNEASMAVMKRLGMRLRGVEQWYERALSTCEISAADWVANFERLQQDAKGEHSSRPYRESNP